MTGVILRDVKPQRPRDKANVVDGHQAGSLKYDSNQSVIAGEMEVIAPTQ